MLFDHFQQCFGYIVVVSFNGGETGDPGEGGSEYACNIKV
jgi:hypothetical protein